MGHGFRTREADVLSPASPEALCQGGSASVGALVDPQEHTLPDRSPRPAPVQFLDKIRYQEYNFSALTHCTPENVGGIRTTVSKECRWHQQWHARNSLELGAVRTHPALHVVNRQTAFRLQLRPQPVCERQR
jgi:hypothetical protein